MAQDRAVRGRLGVFWLYSPHARRRSFSDPAGDNGWQKMRGKPLQEVDRHKTGQQSIAQ
jgi:hypothetical protein